MAIPDRCDNCGNEAFVMHITIKHEKFCCDCYTEEYRSDLNKSEEHIIPIGQLEFHKLAN